ncbi:MAG: S41 family peptidase [Pseudomonadota bacterium]
MKSTFAAAFAALTLTASPNIAGFISMSEGTHGLFSAASAQEGTAQEDPWEEIISTGTARRELTALYDGLQAAHYDLFVHRAKDDYDAYFRKTLEGLTAPLTRYDYHLTLQKFAAYGNVAHARIDYPSEVYQAYRQSGGRAFPIYFRIVDGRAYVSEDYSGLDAINAGDEVLSIDGVSMTDWLDRTAQYVAADTDYIAHSLLEFWFPMYLWVEAGERATFKLRLRSPKGRKRRVEVPALTSEELEANAKETPETFALDNSSRISRMLDDEIAYLRPGPFYNVENPDQLWNTSDFVAFVDRSFEDFIENSADALIIDLRTNPGGDNSFSDPMIAWIADEPFRFASKFLVRSSDQAAASNQARLDANPGAVEGVSGQYARLYEVTPRGEVFDFEIPFAQPKTNSRFDGDVFVLINRHSFSNAVNVASIFQDYSWGVIVGEKTSDMATTYGAMEQFALPETGIIVGFPKAHIIRPNGNTQVDGVTPEIVIETPIVGSTDDVVLAKLVEIIKAR